ncbi:MAG TPA: 16S rRNA (cytidine(1402)-2'-O)-methyltransferase [Minicystis sp.]|nr:16S rRNA (cytidine(1402)-2'-O)-methyltransferase [Minicystis sp.]
MAGRLFVVATPIGNLGDVTLRAVEVLKGADRVVAEDTRQTRKLLSHLGVAGKPLARIDAHAGPEALERVVAAMRDAAEQVALVTDAGTPVVSDPGAELVARAAAAGVEVVAVPGPSAALAALSISGFSGAFRFFGFLPRGGPERREAIARVAATDEVAILFESPQRIAATLEELARVMPERRAVVARELTKLHEEAVRGTLAELAGAPREWLGEITLVLGPAVARAAAAPSPEELDARIDAELAAGRRAKDVAELLSLETGRPRRELYERVVARKR